MSNYYEEVPSDGLELHAKFTEQITKAVKQGDRISLLNFQACLKSNEEQKKVNIENVLRFDFSKFDRRIGRAIAQFRFQVPDDYKHTTQLKDFRKRCGFQFYSFSEEITDENYSNVSHKLKRGKYYTVSFFPILEPLKSWECLGILRWKKSLLVGPQGMSFARACNKDGFPVDYTFPCFDVRENLYKDAKGHRPQPWMYQSSINDWRFTCTTDLDMVVWEKKTCLVAFNQNK